MQLDRCGLDRLGNLDRSCDYNYVSLRAFVSSESDVYAELNRVIHLAAAIDSESDVEARLQLTALLGAAVASESDVYAQLYYVVLLSADVNSVSDIYAMLRKLASIEFTFSGVLAAGETVCIDGRKFTVKNNGSNAVGDFTGDYPTIYPGTNWIIYEDSEGSRNVRLIVVKGDREI